MTVFSYWTIPYVSIDDRRLIYLYNLGFLVVLGALFGDVFVHRTYLDSDVLHGITEARLKTPHDWSPRPEQDPFCDKNLCVKWDADEVGYSYTSDSIFVTTRIKDALEKSVCDQETRRKFKSLGNTGSKDEVDEEGKDKFEDDHEHDADVGGEGKYKDDHEADINDNAGDGSSAKSKLLKSGGIHKKRGGNGGKELHNHHSDSSLESCEADSLENSILECAEYKRVSKKYYYPYKVDDFHMAINAYAEALEFCSTKKFTTRSEEDINDLVNSCPYVYVMRNFPGELVSYNGSVLHRFDGKRGDGILRDVPIWKFLEAAGVNSLDSRISQTNKILRDKGGVFMITIKFHLDLEEVGYFGGFFSNPDTQLLPTKFTVRVEKLAQAGYKVREVVGHSRTHRRVRTSYGLHFKLMLAGQARKFSWSKLLSEIILKFGLFGIITTILDILWQIVFPMMGFPDYNDLVYKNVRHPELENSGEDGEINDLEKLGEGEDKKTI